MSQPILDQNSFLTPNASEEILKMASVLDCECPRYLVKILETVREFRKYEQSCAVTHPKDKEVHVWLEGAAENLDRMLSATISQLARMEGMIDENNCIVPLKKDAGDR